MENTQSEPNKGLCCPSCTFVIKFSMETLLTQNLIVCPSCGISMEMSVPAELKKHLQEIVLAEKMVHDAQRFSK